MRSAAAIAVMNLRRLVRDRTSVFFVFVFPFLIILALGATFGAASTPKLGVVDTGAGALGQDLARRLDATADLSVVTYTDPSSLRDAVERGRVEGGLVIPDGYDGRVRAGETVPLDYAARPSSGGEQLRLTVASVVDEQGVAVRAARVAVAEGSQPDFASAYAAAQAAAKVVPAVAVSSSVAGASGDDYTIANGAAQELVLFVFVTSLSAASMLIESRRLGCSRRMLASPTPVRDILLGEGLGRYAIALLQAILIVLGTALLFRVSWGDLATTGLTIALLAATATGAAMLMGAVLHNEQQAGALGVFLGLGLAALGGAMVPLEIFPPVMERVAHLTPHAWAIQALDDAMAGATPAEVATNLMVLAVYATVLIAGATILFRRTLTGPQA
ncbi:MAG: ABC transporter permease [Planctomycetaceae bacterium]